MSFFLDWLSGNTLKKENLPPPNLKTEAPYYGLKVVSKYEYDTMNLKEDYENLKKNIKNAETTKIGKDVDKVFDIINSLNEELNPQDDVDKDKSRNNRKDYYINHFSYAIVTTEAIEKIKEFLIDNNCKVLLEIGSGFGLWASLINLYINIKIKKNVKVIATDKVKYPDEYLYYKISKVDYIYAIPDKEEKDLNTCLFLCWPPPNSDVAFRSLKQFQGNYLIFIGEEKGGIVANDEFFDALEKEWAKKSYAEIPRWFGNEDFLIFYERKVKTVDGKSRRRQSSKRKSKKRRRKSKRRYS
jgi:hypothetical protein